MDPTTTQMLDATVAAKNELARTSGSERDAFLHYFATGLAAAIADIQAVNATEVDAARSAGLTTALCDRLDLAGNNYQAMITAIKAVADLPDPIGTIQDAALQTGGITVGKMRVPLGLVCFIYESRPTVTAEGAALCIKSGNAVILRGGSEALRSNLAIAAVARQALTQAGLPAAAIAMVPTAERAQINDLLVDDRLDLIIPRGGYELVKHVTKIAQAPVLAHVSGNCHLYVDRDADLAMARRLIINAKCQRPGTCNALESLLIHTDIARQLLPDLAADLVAAGVAIVGCPHTIDVLGEICAPATPADWDTEYLDLKLSVKVINDLDAAITWVNQHGSSHTDGIVTNDSTAAARFQREVDSSSVLVNTSTRFADGFMYGLGAETGIATGKFHARGPVGLFGLTSEKWVVTSSGAVRS